MPPKLVSYRNAIVLILLMSIFCSCKKDKPTIPGPGGLVVSNVTDTSCTISWQAVNNATGYKLTISADSLFNTTLPDYNALLITGTVENVFDLTPSTKYFIKVIAVSDNISSSPASTSFITLDADRLVIVGSENGNLYALDAKSGAVKWSLNTGKIYASATIVDKVVYIGSEDGRLYAINAVDGSIKWATGLAPTGSFYTASATVKNAVVYIGDYGGRFYAFNAADGTLKWYYDVPSPYRNIGTSSVIENGVVYFASYDGKIYAFDAVTGVFKWVSGSTGNPITSGLSLQNNTIYVGALPKVYAFDAATGVTKWISSTPQYASFSSSPTVKDNTVFIGGEDGTFYAYDASTGVLKWKKFLSNGSIVSSPIGVNGVIYIGGGDGKLYALNADSGDILWANADLGTQNIYSGPTISAETIYGGTLSGNVFAVDAQTGVTKWKAPVSGGRFQSSPCILTYEGKVYHPGISGEIQ